MIRVHIGAFRSAAFAGGFAALVLNAGVAGALYVPQVGIINPSEMTPAASIEIAIWTAVGGRATLIGPIVGAFFIDIANALVNQHIGLEETDDGVWSIYFNTVLLATLDERDFLIRG